MEERRRYRFRAWHKTERQMYPVIMVGRGGAVIQEAAFERTVPLADVRLMQYSGVVDSNGTEIYEADVLVDKTGRAFEVDLRDGSFSLIAKDSEPEILSSKFVAEHRLKVTGNIYQSK